MGQASHSDRLAVARLPRPAAILDAARTDQREHTLGRPVPSREQQRHAACTQQLSAQETRPRPPTRLRTSLDFQLAEDAAAFWSASGALTSLSRPVRYGHLCIIPPNACYVRAGRGPIGFRSRFSELSLWTASDCELGAREYSRVLAFRFSFARVVEVSRLGIVPIAPSGRINCTWAFPHLAPPAHAAAESALSLSSRASLSDLRREPYF